jgi:DNA-binding beta-propeller fold protein YncE
MERMKSRFPAAAVLAGVVLLGAGCSAHAAAPTGGHASPVAASPALPSPFTITARYTAKSLGLDHPTDLTIGPDGNVYVTDRSQRVTVISPGGKVLRRWGKPGSKPGEFKFIGLDPSTPKYLEGKITAGPDRMVYVSDSGNARVQVFTPGGRFIRQFGSYGTGKGQFLHPFDLVVDGTGNVYVADDVTQTFAKFSPAGNVIWTIVGSAATDPDLAGHFHVTSIDAHGRLVVTNDDINRVLYIDPDGHKVDAFSPSSSGSPSGHVCEATVDAAGTTYVSGCVTTGPTLVYDRAHRLIARWPGRQYSLLRSPDFGPKGEVFALATDGSILKLRITPPGA